MNLVRFDHVGAAYGPTPVVEDVSFTVDDGEFVGVVGPSGSGKTTVLRLLLGLVAPAYGSVERRAGLRIGYVPQLERIEWSFPVTVRDVVEMAVPVRFGRRRERRRVAAAILERLGLTGLDARQIRNLSGGQQQRVFLARSLVGDPDLVVLDEPTSGLDVATRHEILHLLSELHDPGGSGPAVLLTTHDVNGLAAHLPRLICFNRTVVADGPPGEVLHPYVLERTFGAPMEVLRHGGMPVVVESRQDP